MSDSERLGRDDLLRVPGRRDPTAEYVTPVALSPPVEAES